MRFIRSSVYVPRRSVVAFGPSSRLAHRRLPLRAFVLGGLALILLAFAGPSWSQTLLGADIDGKAADDQSGYSVSLSSDGTRVAIGAYLNDGNGDASGHVRVYDWNGTAWTQLGTDIDGEAASDLSGRSVSLSSDGTRVAIGAPWNGSNGSNSGHVRVYHFASVYSATTPVPSVPYAPTPVPTLPLFGLGILASLLGLFGLRRLRQ